MATQQLIYTTAVPVTQEQHGDTAIEMMGNYGFASALTSVPLLAVEFVRAASSYPVVFAGDGKVISPVAILGARDGENLYIDEEGTWKADYIPAFVRRYPFVFASSEDQQTFTLCIDNDFKGLNKEGRGQRIFTEEGKATEYVNGVLKFLQDYRNQHLLTQTLCEKIKALDILEPMEAKFNLPSGQTLMLNGFLVINREKLQALTDEQITDLARSDLLELIYLHLQSMRHFTDLKDRLVAATKATAAAQQGSKTAH